MFSKFLELSTAIRIYIYLCMLILNGCLAHGILHSRCFTAFNHASLFHGNDEWYITIKSILNQFTKWKLSVACTHQIYEWQREGASQAKNGALFERFLYWVNDGIPVERCVKHEIIIILYTYKYSELRVFMFDGTQKKPIKVLTFFQIGWELANYHSILSKSSDFTFSLLIFCFAGNFWSFPRTETIHALRTTQHFILLCSNMVW